MDNVNHHCTGPPVSSELCYWTARTRLSFHAMIFNGVKDKTWSDVNGIERPDGRVSLTMEEDVDVNTG